MYGLHDMDTQILKEVFEQYDISPIDIRQLKMKHKRYDDQTIYVLYFKNEDKMTLEKLRTVRHITNVLVKFEHYTRTRTGFILCANCLHYGHGQSTCNIKARCIKCGKEHESSNCEYNLVKNNPRSKIPDELVKCANCGGPHTANYSKCPERLKYIRIQGVVREKLVKPRVPYRSNPVRNDRQFASETYSSPP